MRTLIAFLAAAFVPAILITGWYLFGQFETFEPDDPYIWVRTGKILYICTLISTAYVLLLGVPTYYIFSKLKIIRWWSTTGVGFILGVTPMAILTWPLSSPELRTSASVNGTQTMIDGTPTMAGWLARPDNVDWVAGWRGIHSLWSAYAETPGRLCSTHKKGPLAQPSFV